eukprot:jgi/Bigna1/77838/fgenesh1_pg.50_\
MAPSTRRLGRGTLLSQSVYAAVVIRDKGQDLNSGIRPGVTMERLALSLIALPWFAAWGGRLTSNEELTCLKILSWKTTNGMSSIFAKILDGDIRIKTASRSSCRGVAPAASSGPLVRPTLTRSKLLDSGDIYKIAKVRNIRAVGLHVKSHPSRIEMLNEIGFIWDDNEFRFRQTMKSLQAYLKVYGELSVPVEFVVPAEDPWDPICWGVPLGVRVHNIRAHDLHIKNYPNRK